MNLIGIKNRPPGWKEARMAALEAKAYFDLTPYPYFAFEEWKTEIRGSLPKCLPIVRTHVRKSARWLFKKPISISCDANKDLAAWLSEMWRANRMHSVMQVAARRAANDGYVALKFSYNAKDATPLRISVLYADQVTFYYDPHDVSKVTMARVEYPFYDNERGAWYWYREDWQNDQWGQYDPVPDASAEQQTPTKDPRKSSFSDPTQLPWGPPKIQANPFGVIPITQIKNLETDSAYGEGDFWGTFRIVDRVNLSFHLMDRSNQFESDPLKVFIDAKADIDDIEAPLPPGSALDLKSEDNGKQAQAFLLEPKGNLRPAMMEYAREVMAMLRDSVGAVEIRPELVTNKGAMTEAVLTQLYAPLIELTDSKRQSFGEDGIAKFLESAAVGLKNLGAREVRSINLNDPETYNIEIGWPKYFELSSEDIGQSIDNQTKLISAGLTTKEHAGRAIASILGIDNIDDFVEDLMENDDLGESKQPEPKQTVPPTANGEKTLENE